MEDAVELAAIDRGAGTPVMLVHGGIYHSGPAWASNIHPIVSAGYRVIAVDRRGHGRSPSGGDDPVPLSAQAADLAYTLDLRGVPVAHFIGASYGALVCLEFALAHPSRVYSLVLMEPPLFTSLAGDPEYAEWLDHLRTAHSTSTSSKELRRWLPGFMRLIDGRMAAEIDGDSPAWPLIERHAPQAAREERAWSYRPEEKRIRALQAPVLVLNGDQSEPAMQVIGQDLAGRLPRGRHAFIEGGGHDAHARQPHQFNASVVEFMRAARREH